MAKEPITNLDYQESNSIRTDSIQNAELNHYATWLNPVVLAVGQAAPTGSEVDGDRYIVGTGTGAFLGWDGRMAVKRAGAWQSFVPPTAGVPIVKSLADGADWELVAGVWAAKGTSGGAAVDIAYDNTASGLAATNTQDAIDEIAAMAAGAGTGDVVGPVSSTNNHVALFDGVTGKQLKDGGAFTAAGIGADPAGSASTAQAAAIAAAASDATTKANAAAAASQPLDSDLTAIAALTTASFGRSLLAETSAENARSTLGVSGENIAEPVNVLTPVAGVLTINCALGDYFTLAPTANITSTVFTNLPAAGKAQTIMIEFTQDTTPRTWAWPSSAKWPGGVAGAVSTGSGAKDLVAMTTFDQGTTQRMTISKAFA